MPRNVQQSKESFRPRRPSDRLPHLFGRGGRDRVLLCLAVNGPMHGRHIARLLGMNAHKIFRMVEYLREAGIVVKREQPGAYKYIALNRALPVYEELRNLLLAMEKHWPSPRIEKVTARWHMPWNGSPNDRIYDALFQSAVRSRVLLFIAAAGVTYPKAIYDTLKLDTVSALHAVNHWEREGVVRSIHRDGKRFVALNPTFEVAAELKALLDALIKNSNEWRNLKKHARQSPQYRATIDEGLPGT